MTFNKSRGGPGGQRPAGSRVDPGQSIDASPSGTAPRNLRETKIWKDSESGMKRMWANYVNTLKDSFRQMPRAEQEQFIKRICVTVTLGVAALVFQFFYPFLPQLLRVLSLPIMLVAAYWAATKIVTPVMIIRYEEYLNRDF